MQLGENPKLFCEKFQNFIDAITHYAPTAHFVVKGVGVEVKAKEPLITIAKQMNLDVYWKENQYFIPFIIPTMEDFDKVLFLFKQMNDQLKIYLEKTPLPIPSKKRLAKKDL